MSKFPYHFCLVSRDDIANINLQNNEIVLQTHNNMRLNYNQNSESSVCIEDIYNIFWDLPRSLVDELDHRLAAIPRFSGLKIFANGLQSISRLTANEYRDLMKVMIFAINNLYDTNINSIEDIISNKDLVILYESWNKMYAISKYEVFKESDLEEFKESINDWSQKFIKIFKHISSSELKLPKLHSWIYHIIEIIQSFGAINGYTTETYESLHKEYVKIPYQLSNKKEIESLMAINCKKKSNPIIKNSSKKISDSNINDKMKTGFNKFENCLNMYLDQLDISSAEDGKVTIYGLVTLENGAIMRATNSFHKKSWFSDISVCMNFEELLQYSSDQSICYRQVLLIVYIDIEEQGIMSNLALIWQYDFKL
ncbi:hypothetical protein RclHR1_29910001 [Rhizophagus clarus]|uniref:Uncharacterized protein n=1 Tax=Rhizophagus clarus TaxID=94130 RepID=A0A2Z6R8Y4_9GLOM|nr:hypothetical protein RclHR1_29910001 [Rhizophagus clarus]GET02947.1 hypothetical protein GLOIN_2v1783703 [Rhizophagus clarus]